MLLPDTVKAAVFLLYPAVVSSRIVPFSTTDSYATPEDSSVITWRNEQKAFARFQLPCHGCSIDSDDGLVFELSTGTTDAACGPIDIDLNGNELSQSWDGASGSGSGLITAESVNGEGRPDLAASWQSLCIPHSSESPSENDRPAMVLTVQINQIDRDEVDREVGFTVSFRQLGTPEILRLDPSPLSISNNDSSLDLESWRDPPPSNRLRVQTIARTQNGRDSIDEILEAEIEEFQDLQFRVHELEQLITQKEDKIRKLLQQDCRSISSQVGQCESFGCFFQACFSAFPEVISRLRCRYGSLDSCLSRKPSLGCGVQEIISESQASGGLGEANREYPLNGSTEHSTSHSLGAHTEYGSSDAARQGNSHSSSSSSKNTGSSYTDDYFHFNRNYFALIVVLILSYCLFRRCLQACRSPRRRADRAARREECRNRHAYRCAARRHRWRQWWNGGQRRGHESSSHEGSNSDLERGGGSETVRRESISDASSIFQEGAMHAEILGLRRALEFVGELVRPEDPGYQSQPRRYARHVYDRAGSPFSRPAPPASSTTMLTTIGSPRTSSLMSCDDTGSSVTLETLEPDPPEYRK